MAARDKAAAIRDRDGRTSAVAFDHGGDGGDLSSRVRVRVFRVRFQLGHLDELIVGAVDFHSGERERKGTAPHERTNGCTMRGLTWKSRPRTV